MSSSRCETCKEWVFFDSHRCPPKYQVRQVWPNGDVDDWRDFYARDPEEAAEKWAERYDSYGDYTIVNGSSAIVDVMDEEETVTKFEVTGESVPSYRAYEHKPSPPSTRKE
jgi:hypothetical protein